MHATITEAPIRLEDLLAAGSAADGALLLFVGRVRNHDEGRTVSRLTYEAYREMAETELADILAEAAVRYDPGHLEAVHRTGTLEVGEVSVAIAIASPHRASAYEASRYVIEEIKQRLPVWKLEHFADGERDWVNATSAADSAGERR